eukprot:m.243940 g.243940  ORF g.243940 m.243940 type:complete len:61 (-) comp15838_c0_seq1:1376-1558(-)
MLMSWQLAQLVGSNLEALVVAYKKKMISFVGLTGPNRRYNLTTSEMSGLPGTEANCDSTT